MAWVRGDERTVADADAAVKEFDQRAQMVQPWGKRHNTIIFGPADGARETGPLRIDIDLEADRTALRWLPDNLYAVELDPSDSITAGFYEPEEIPAELARVSVTTARQAVAEYVTTGQKPTDVEWAAG